MVVSFANNLVMVCNNSTSIIYTDPVPMSGFDRCIGILLIHYIFGTSALLSIQLQASNDGTTWIDVGAPDTANSEGAAGVGTTGLSYAFIRYEFTFSASDAGGLCFDLPARLDHA